MTTARAIVTSALRKLQVLGVGQSLTADQAQEALDALNDMIASWNVEGYTIWTQTKEVFPLTSATSYTIGTGGDFNTSRPEQIISAFARQNGGVNDYPLELIDGSQYARFDQKSVPGIPQALWYDGNYPLGNITLAPTPFAGWNLHLYSYKGVTSFSTINTDLDIPPGQKRALIYNLAVEIAPEYEREASPTTKKIAYDSKRNIEVSNTRNNYNERELPVNVGGNNPWRRHNNIFSGF